MKVCGINEGKTLWRIGDCWIDDESMASEFTIPEAERIVRITNANNRFLDREDRIEAHTVESR